MGFKQGNNFGGRKEGSQNKATQKVREAFTQLIEDNLDKLQEDLNSLEPKDRLRSIMDLAAYVLPKLKSIEKLVFSTGFYKVKSKNIHALSKILVNEYNSRIPKTIEELVKLPGVGRKTASVFLAETFDQPTIAVDTHVLRVSHRLGLSTKRHDPIQTEKELKLLFPKDFWRYLSMSFVQFGRDLCDAKKPLCEVCDFNNSCKYYLSLNT